MKNAILLLTGLVSLNLLLVGCTPRDEKIDDPRLKNFRGYNENSKKGAAPQNSIRVGYFALSSILVEKEIEAIQIARIALGVDSAEQAGFAQGEAREDSSVQVIANKAAKVFQSNEGFSSVEQKTYIISAPQEKEAQTQVEVRGTNLSQFISKIETVGSAKLTEGAYLLKVSLSDKDAKTLSVTLETSGTYVLANAGGTGVPVEFDQNVKLVIDRESMKTQNVKVLSANSETFVAFNKDAKKTRIAIEGANHEVVVQGSCVTLTGDSTMVTDKTRKVMSYKDNEATVNGTSFAAKTGACGARPTVDLSRIFIY